MDDNTVKALLELDVVTVSGVKLIQIPYEDILRGKISLTINEVKSEILADSKFDTGTEINPFVDPDEEKAIVIPVEIMKLYESNKSGEAMAQEVADYLKIIAECWGYRNLGFTPSLLKKAATHKPILNRLVLQVYGQKQGDDVLTGLVMANKGFIQKCWEEQDSVGSKE